MKMLKIGIFGGSFNPPHNGHINIAVQAKEHLSLDKMLIMPTKTSPHKGTSAVGFNSREYMCRLAFEGLSGFEVTDIENKLTGKSYTINSLHLLKGIYPKNTEFYLLIGADMLFHFDRWNSYETILNECHVIAAAREPGQFTNMYEYATEIGKIKVLNLEVKQVSSSEVREKISKDQDVSELVPQKVFNYIKQKRFYSLNEG
ncbi:MAG: nicotinate (nicotinamide) nucleotide adenylyltransferase [Oscillospiraceae bacterium]|nr:nicotinate (nicotinamide) nucleotide adenylyltransferase [Oscillospiraceae bacterium]